MHTEHYFDTLAPAERYWLQLALQAERENDWDAAHTFSRRARDARREAQR